MTVADAIRTATERLTGISDTPRLDAELLLARALDTTRSHMLLTQMSAPAPLGWDVLVDERARHVPVAYLLGRQEFWGLDLAVSPAVLIPRGDSETVVRAALAARPDARRVLDLGTGSGALLLAVLSELVAATGVGIEASPEAFAVAAGNVSDLGFADRALIAPADWNDPAQMAQLNRFDLVLCNPPYVEDDADLAPEVRDHEPPIALFAGPEGLEAYRALLPQLPGLLEDDGVAVFEIGHTQFKQVTGIAARAGLASTLHRDLAGRPRALEFKKSLGKTREAH